MKKKNIPLLTFVILVLFLVSGHLWAAEDFVVTDFKPQGSIEERAPLITVVFSAPVTPSETWPLSIYPAIPAEGTWNDPQTFTLKLIKPLSSATQ
ncbi:MAG: hypothetical protein GX305_04495, partial [Aminobacterium colombiense]|nr:hypothetical protein [Aminobacterium colombiense]